MLAHAHEITDFEGREVSSCGLRASNRSEKVWPSFKRTQAVNDHVRDSFSLLSISGSSDEGESAELAASIDILIRKNVFIGQNATLKVCIIEVADLIETLVLLNVEFSLTLDRIQTLVAEQYGTITEV